MKLPSKVIPYKKSVFPIMCKILKELKSSNFTIHELFKKIAKTEKKLTPRLFIESLDLLYILNKIQLINEELCLC